MSPDARYERAHTWFIAAQDRYNERVAAMSTDSTTATANLHTVLNGYEYGVYTVAPAVGRGLLRAEVRLALAGRYFDFALRQLARDVSEG